MSEYNKPDLLVLIESGFELPDLSQQFNVTIAHSETEARSRITLDNKIPDSLVVGRTQLGVLKGLYGSKHQTKGRAIVYTPVEEPESPTDWQFGPDLSFRKYGPDIDLAREIKRILQPTLLYLVLETGPQPADLIRNHYNLTLAHSPDDIFSRVYQEEKIDYLAVIGKHMLWALSTVPGLKPGQLRTSDQSPMGFFYILPNEMVSLTDINTLDNFWLDVVEIIQPRSRDVAEDLHTRIRYPQNLPKT